MGHGEILDTNPCRDLVVDNPVAHCGADTEADDLEELDHILAGAQGQ